MHGTTTEEKRMDNKNTKYKPLYILFFKNIEN